MKKILFPLLGTNKGGNVLSTISILKKIDQNKFKAHILLISSKSKKNIINNLLKKVKIKNINYIYFNDEDNLYLKKIKLVINLINFFYKRKFDIVHTNDGLLNFYFSILNIFLDLN